MWTTFKRVARYGFVGFIRNGFVSLSAIVVMTITLFVLVNALISNAALQSTLTQLTQAVDVVVYLNSTATPAQVADLQKNLQALPEVASVDYVSADQALADFRQRHAGDQLTLQALDELTGNPLEASIEIRAKETSQYEGVAQYLTTQQSQGTADGQAIDKINFNQNKTAIDRLTTIIGKSRENGIAKVALFCVATLLIVFIVIRLAIYTSRDEIGVMNLVGASRWYVRGPFMVAGILYGLVSALVVMILLYPILLFKPVLIGLDPTSEILFGSFDPFGYYTSHIAILLLILLITGMVLGALSSYLAVRRYLRT